MSVFYNSFLNFAKNFSASGWMFFATLLSLITIFIVNISLTICCKSFNVKNTKALFYLSFGFLILQASFSLAGKSAFDLVLLNSAIFSFSLVPFGFISKKQAKLNITTEQKEAVKRIERFATEREGDLEFNQNLEAKSNKKTLISFEEMLQEVEPTKSSNVIKAIKKSQPVKQEENYSGVKSAIIEALGKQLSENEKNQVLNLEFAILQAERGCDSLVVKKQINEGLCALLKIMSKHCV